MAARPRVKIPASAVAGEVISIKTLVSHRMESGQRKDEQGNPIPRHIINRFTAAFDGEVFFSVDIDPAVSANPYLEFPMRVDKPGTFRFVWTDDAGDEITLEHAINVTS